MASEHTCPAPSDRVADRELREYEPGGLSDGVSDSEIPEEY
jgi:hypothetical protein